jgi:Nucleotidyl transferase AbiEii toxin, Type IV TA system
VRYQIAQKLHACTEIIEGRDNDRFRDLIDLLMLAELVPDDQWSETRDACEEVFALRAKHAWPPDLTVFPSWPAAYTALARQMAFPITEVREAAVSVRDLIARIAGAPGRPEVPPHKPRQTVEDKGR